MDISAALSRAEVAALTYPERSCGHAARELGLERVDAAATTSGARQDLTGTGTGTGAFEESLRIKNTLDQFEASAQQQPSWNVLAVLVNCEWMLWMVNRETPLRKNPFLSHWVEVVLRLGGSSIPTVRRAKDITDTLTADDIWVVRFELIKRLLQDKEYARALGDKTPKDLYTEFVGQRQNMEFDIQTYVRMLEEEGIYEKTPEPEPAQDPERSDVSHAGASKAKSSSSLRLDHFQQWKQDILERLRIEPDVALPEITHLPIELSYLDFFTTLLTDRTLESLSIDPAPIITSYIQHALRLVEQMGQPPSSNDSTTTNGGPWDIDHGREAQSRAVRLLLLFTRNLMRKELVRVETLYFEIQEICVRYVWIREVREFRAWVEGVVDEGKAG